MLSIQGWFVIISHYYLYLATCLFRSYLLSKRSSRSNIQCFTHLIYKAYLFNDPCFIESSKRYIWKSYLLFLIWFCKNSSHLISLSMTIFVGTSIMTSHQMLIASIKKLITSKLGQWIIIPAIKPVWCSRQLSEAE